MSIGLMQAYTEFDYRTRLQQFDYLGGTMKGALLLNSYVPDFIADKVWGDISGHEITDGDYAPLVLAGKTIARDGAGRVVYSHDALNFGANVTITAKYLIRYLDGATKYLMSCTDLNDGGGNLVVTGAPLVISLNAAGLYRSDP